VKVTRIAFSKNLNQDKLERLTEIAARLGALRTELWGRFGSVAGVGVDQRELRNRWLAEKRKFNVPARLWKETLRDTMADIALYREVSGWVKGAMAEAIETVSQRRGSSLSLVNAAYTSQMDSRYGALLGQRSGDTFYGFDQVVQDADTNAARNILARRDDTEISLYTPYKQVKAILLRRTAVVQKRLGLLGFPLGQDTSCNGYQLESPLSTVSEEPNFYE
jgi:hypothetical protein